MVKESITDKVVFVTVVPAEEDKFQRPHHSFRIRAISTTSFLIDKLECLVIPASDVLPELAQGFAGEVNQHNIDTNFT
jgi:hypothetical protein